jgi:hypothetical protein
MSSTRNVVMSGVVAAIIAIGLIAALLFVPGVGLTSQTQSSSVPNNVQASSTEAETTQQASGNQGTLAVLLTDPPTIPANVSAVYVQYGEVEAHIADAGNQTGWYDLTGSGEINLLSVVNVSETIANQSLPQGKFNGLRFNITSILVTYEGQNETGLMVSGHSTSYVWIPGGIMVNALETSTAMIDYTPTVVLAGNVTNPTFVFIPAAIAYVIPNSSVPAESHMIGTKIDLNTNPWWLATQSGTKFAITHAMLTPNSLNMTILNQGSSPVLLRFAAVTTQSTVSGGFEGIFATSEVFAVGSGGLLVPLVPTGMGMMNSQMSSSPGLLLAPGQSIALHYSGSIKIGAQQLGLHFEEDTNSSIVVGSFYHVLVQGSSQLAQAAVQATAS